MKRTEAHHAPALLFLADLAPILGLASPSAARRFVLKQGVPFVRVGRRLAVRPVSLDAWLAERETRTEGPPVAPPVPTPPAWARDLLKRGRRNRA